MSSQILVLPMTKTLTHIQKKSSQSIATSKTQTQDRNHQQSNDTNSEKNDASSTWNSESAGYNTSATSLSASNTTNAFAPLPPTSSSHYYQTTHTIDLLAIGAWTSNYSYTYSASTTSAQYQNLHHNTTSSNYLYPVQDVGFLGIGNWTAEHYSNTRYENVEGSRIDGVEDGGLLDGGEGEVGGV